MKGKYKDWGFLHMELYNLYIDNDIETTKFADVFFEPESKYTGVSITGKLSRMITGNEINKIINGKPVNNKFRCKIQTLCTR